MADNRPHPILGKVKTVGGALSALTGLVAWGGTYGFLTTTQTAATSAFIALVPGVVAGVGAMLTSFGVGKSSEPLVTPLSDPRDNAGERLLSVSEHVNASAARPGMALPFTRDPGEDASTF